MLLSTEFGDINNPLSETILPTFYQGDLNRELTRFKQLESRSKIIDINTLTLRIDGTFKPCHGNGLKVPILIGKSAANYYFEAICWKGHWYSENRILIVSDCLTEDSLRRSGILIIDTLGQIIDTVAIDDSPRAYLGGFSYLNMSPDQTTIIASYSYVTSDSYSHGDFRQYSLNGTLIRIISPEAGVGRWSPDGTKIVFQKYTFMGHSPYPDLFPDYGRVTPWICNADGSDMHELLGWPQPAPDSTMFDGGYNWVTDTYAP